MTRLTLAAACAALATAAPAQEGGFYPSDNCLHTLQNATDAEMLILAGWIMGYLDSRDDAARLLRLDNAQVVLRNLGEACTKRPNLTLLQVVQASKQDSADEPGSRADAERLLKQFLQPGADYVALVAALKPTEADIRAVYAAPLADKLVPTYAAMFTPGARFGPKEGQTELLIWHGHMDRLKQHDPVLSDFPGGYKDVLPYMIGDAPIVRFKFVRPGETLGLAFDGLIYVNGRWVLMPKPWRVLEN